VESLGNRLDQSEERILSLETRLKNYLTQILINKKQEENKKSFKEKHMNT
jgi:hypothetical protein